jgi:hypothetical protein
VLVVELLGMLDIVLEGVVVVVVGMRLEVVGLGTVQVVGKFDKSFLVDIVFVVGSLGRVGEQGIGFVVGMGVVGLELDMMDMMGMV